MRKKSTLDIIGYYDTPKAMTERTRISDGSSDAYNEAGNICARAIVNAAMESELILRMLAGVVRLSYNRDNMPHWQRIPEEEGKLFCQEHFEDIEDLVWHSLRQLTPIRAKEIEEIGPTGFMWEWAVNAAAHACKELNLIDHHGWITSDKGS